MHCFYLHSFFLHSVFFARDFLYTHFSMHSYFWHCFFQHLDFHSLNFLALLFRTFNFPALQFPNTDSNISIRFWHTMAPAQPFGLGAPLCLLDWGDNGNYLSVLGIWLTSGLVSSTKVMSLPCPSTLGTIRLPRLPRNSHFLDAWSLPIF